MDANTLKKNKKEENIMFKNIDITKLQPHPQNPRKNVGDISELAESIKKNGVFQNLTVVPNGDDTYTIIIGHRRHAAAKKAGLIELPCAVVEMTKKEQLSTMLLENMQREDLTALEQAEGFQMMIDLGESVKSISEQTGFSPSTVRHRVKLLELDRDTLEKQGREIPITAYIKLEQIKDVDRRNKVLKEIGTNNFDWALKRAIDDEKKQANKKYWKSTLAQMDNATDISKLSYAERREKYSYTSFIGYSSELDAALKKIPKEPFYYAIDDRYIDFYKELTAVEKSDDEKTLAREKAEQERKKKQTALENVEQMCQESFFDFVDKFKSKQPSDTQIIFRLFVLLALDRNHNYDELDMSSVLSEKQLEMLEDGGKLSDVPTFRDVPSALLKVAIKTYARFECYNWDNQYEENNDLIAIYECIQELGYKASNEELAYIYGTHEFFSESEE